MCNVTINQERMPCRTCQRPAQQLASRTAHVVVVMPRRGCGGFGRRLFTFEDELRPNAAAAVAALRGGTWRGRRSSSDCMRVLMLTGADATCL